MTRKQLQFFDEIFVLVENQIGITDKHTLTYPQIYIFYFHKIEIIRYKIIWPIIINVRDTSFVTWNWLSIMW